MPQYEVRVKKIEVSYCWVTVNTKDVANAEKRAVEMAPSLAQAGSFDEPEPAAYQAEECLELKTGQTQPRG